MNSYLAQPTILAAPLSTPTGSAASESNGDDFAKRLPRYLSTYQVLEGANS